MAAGAVSDYCSPLRNLGSFMVIANSARSSGAACCFSHKPEVDASNVTRPADCGGSERRSFRSTLLLRCGTDGLNRLGVRGGHRFGQTFQLTVDMGRWDWGSTVHPLLAVRDGSVFDWLCGAHKPPDCKTRPSAQNLWERVNTHDWECRPNLYVPGCNLKNPTQPKVKQSTQSPWVTNPNHWLPVD